MVAIGSVFLQEYHDTNSAKQLTTLRLVRLTRLARVVRLFRLRRMKELKLMVSGLFSGMWTLLWAMILLVAFNYIMSLCMVAIVAVTPQRNKAFETDARPLFSSVEMSMMTG